MASRHRGGIISFVLEPNFGLLTNLLSGWRLWHNSSGSSTRCPNFEVGWFPNFGAVEVLPVFMLLKMWKVTGSSNGARLLAEDLNWNRQLAVVGSDSSWGRDWKLIKGNRCSTGHSNQPVNAQNRKENVKMLQQPIIIWGKIEKLRLKLKFLLHILELFSSSSSSC